MAKVVLRVRREGHLLASWTLDERSIEVALIDMATGRELAHVTASGDPPRIFQGVDEMPLDRVVRLEGDDFTIPYPETTLEGADAVAPPPPRKAPRPVHQLARPTDDHATPAPVPAIDASLVREAGDDLTMPLPDHLKEAALAAIAQGDEDERSLSLPLPEHLKGAALAAIADGDDDERSLSLPLPEHFKAAALAALHDDDDERSLSLPLPERLQQAAMEAAADAALEELSLPLPEGRLDEIVGQLGQALEAPELSLPLPEATLELYLPQEQGPDGGLDEATHGGNGAGADHQPRAGSPLVEQVRGVRRRPPIIETPTEPSRPSPRPAVRAPLPPQPAEVWVRKNHEWRSAGHLVGRQRVTLLGGWIRLDDDGKLVVCPGNRLAGSGTMLDGRTVDLADDPAPVAFPAGSSVVLRQGAHGIYVRSEPPMELTPAGEDPGEPTDTFDNDLGLEPGNALDTGVWPSKWHVPR